MKRIVLVTIASLVLALGIASADSAAWVDTPIGPATDQPKPQYDMLP